MVFLAFVFSLSWCLPVQAEDELAIQFQSPPRKSGIWVYWWWLNGYVSREGIVRELESMEGQGIAGVAIFHGGKTYTPRHTPFMSEEWRGYFRFAVQEAAKRGIQVSLNICEGWNAGGPWIDEEHASMWLQHAVLKVEGPTNLDRQLPEFPTDERRTCPKDLFVFAWKLQDGICRSQSFVDVSRQVDKSGRIGWKVPDGEWVIVRFGRFILQGRGYIKYSNHPDFEKKYFEANEMDEEAVRIQFQHTAKVFAEELREYVGKTFTDVFIDSSETAQPDWTGKFFQHFQRLRGYDARPYMAAKARLTVDGEGFTARFLEDYTRTQGDLIGKGYYGEFTRLAAECGLGTHSQSAGHQKPTVDALQSLGANTSPMSEFWARVPGWKWIHQAAQVQLGYHDGIRSAASAAHIYGRTIVCAEAFSAPYSRQAYSAPLYDLKDSGDRAFCQGLNRMVLCYLAHQPECEKAMPGYVGFPHVFSVNDTWWDWSRVWFDYLNRCQMILQSGSFAADVCYFQGEWVPSFVQSKWMMDPSLPKGYDCDVVNSEILGQSAAVNPNGELVLPGGMSYRYLVLNQAGYRPRPPDNQIFPKPADIIPKITQWPDVASGNPLALSPNTLKRIKDLVEGGVTLIGVPPKRAIGLANHPACDHEIATLAALIWGETPGLAGSRKVGKGRVIWGKKLREVMAADALLPDVEYAEDESTSALPLPIETDSLIPDPSGFDWIHRRSGGTDFYFVVNYRNVSAGAVFTFRQSGRQPELWDPLTGALRDLPEFATTPDNRTAVPLRFAPRQSYFIVFRKPMLQTQSGAKMNFPGRRPLQRLEGNWTVLFDPAKGGPAQIVEFPSLTDWRDSKDERIKYYSGIAYYSRTFTLDQAAVPASGRYLLDVGQVEMIARVFLNGKYCGAVWTAPWEVDVSAALKAGENKLEIEVANLWRNRLLGDASKPEAERITKINIEMRPKEALAPSGLIGPIVITRSE